MKVAKLVTFQLTTRVVVDENATEEEIVAESYAGIQAKLDNQELLENVENIVEDKEVPYSNEVKAIFTKKSF